MAKHNHWHAFLRPFLALALTLPFLLLSGCSGSSNKGSTVSGKVMYKGEPLPGGSLKLYPPDGQGAFLLIAIKDDGTFSTGDVPPGSKLVTIEPAETANPGYNMPPGMKPPPGINPTKPNVGNEGAKKAVAIPKKYANPKTSGLTWEINKGKNEKTFELTD